MPGPYSESPNIPGTYRVSQDTVNQILGMGMERALAMARTNPDPEFREAVYRIYPSAAGGSSSTGGTGTAPFNRPQYTDPTAIGAGDTGTAIPGSSGGLGVPPSPVSGSAGTPTSAAATPPPPAPLPNPGGSPMGGPMGGPVGPTGMPNNAPPVPPPPPIPTPTVPTPQVPDQLRELFGLPPVAGGPGGAPAPGIDIGAGGVSAGGGSSPAAGVSGGSTGGLPSVFPLNASGSANLDILGAGPTNDSPTLAGGGVPAPQSEAIGTGGGGILGGVGSMGAPNTGSYGDIPVPPGGRASSGPFEGIGQTNPMARQLLEKRMLSNPVSDTVDFLGTGIGGFHNFGPSNDMNSDLANMILEMLGIPTSRTNR